MKRMYEESKYDIGIMPQAINMTSVTGNYFDMSTYRSGIFVLSTGAIADTKSAKIELMQAKDATGTDAKVITGAEATILATGVKANGIAFVEFKGASLDVNNDFTHVAAKVTTDDNITVSVQLIRGNGRYSPIQQVDALTVV